jgi:broad specificity phosphatase PhoE
MIPFPTLLAGALSIAVSSPPGALNGIGPVPRGSVRVFFVRHGQAYSNLDPKPRLSPEQLDRLTARGRAQAQRTADALRGHGVTLVMTSPAGRARETGEIIRMALGTPPVSEETRARSLALGRSPSGQALGWDEREAEWKAGRDPAPEGGESLQQLSDRLLDLVASLSRAHPGQSVVVVTHGEVVAALVGALQGQPAHLREEVHVENASVTVVEATPGKPTRLVLVNVISPEAAKP